MVGGGGRAMLLLLTHVPPEKSVQPSRQHGWIALMCQVSLSIVLASAAPSRITEMSVIPLWHKGLQGA